MATTTTRTRETSTSFNWKSTSPNRGTRTTPEMREQMIREKAYYLAEQDGFRCDPTYYWCEAERRINEEN